MDWGKTKFFLGEVLHNFTRNAGMQATAIGTVAVTIILLGAFLFVRAELAHMGSDVLSQISISAYMDPNASAAQIDSARTALAKDKRVLDAQYITKKEGLRELRERMKGQIDTSILTENPLPDKFRVHVRNPEQVPAVAASLRKISGVQSVDYGQDVVARLLQLGAVARRVGIAVIVLFVVVAGIIISNTIRLTVFARRREISIMQLVGATNLYIRMPFICEGLLDGVLGAFVAIGLLAATRASLLPKLSAALPWLQMNAVQIDLSSLVLGVARSGRCGGCGRLVDSGRTLPAHLGADAGAEGLIHVDGDRRIVRFNAAAERTLGYSSGSVIGSELRALLHESAASESLPAQLPVEPQILRLTFRGTSGEPVRVQARCAAILREGRPEGWVLLFSTSERIDEIEQLKNELVSTVSHELKTPLAAIKAYAATLRNNPTLYESRRDEYLAVVEEQADRLARLVDDMLMVSRVEGGLLLRQRVLVPLEPLLREAAAQTCADPARHPMRIHAEGVHVSGDPDRLRDVFRNLIKNAVKYSPAGGAVSIAASQTEDCTYVEVQDHGVGIAAEHQPFIYDRFYRVESDAASRVGGSGLGLYIVNALVRAHGGSVDVHSALGEGTTFTVRLPLR